MDKNELRATLRKLIENAFIEKVTKIESEAGQEKLFEAAKNSAAAQAITEIPGVSDLYSKAQEIDHTILNLREKIKSLESRKQQTYREIGLKMEIPSNQLTGLYQSQDMVMNRFKARGNEILKDMITSNPTLQQIFLMQRLRAEYEWSMTKTTSVEKWFRITKDAMKAAGCPERLIEIGNIEKDYRGAPVSVGNTRGGLLENSDFKFK